ASKDGCCIGVVLKSRDEELHHKHVPPTEVACWTVADHVSLRGFMEGRISATDGLEGTVRTHRDGLCHRLQDQLLKAVGVEDIFVGIGQNVAKAERAITSFSQHSTLI